jgi:hypothetical protein
MFKHMLLTGYAGSPELALAFAVTRPFRRLFFPVEIGTAAAAARVFPVLTRFNITGLITATNNLITKKTVAGAADTATVAKGAHSDDAAPASPKLLAKMGTMVDKYGVAFLLSARYVGIGLVFGVEHVLSMGVDLKAWLEDTGLGVVGTCRCRSCQHF